MVLPRHRPVLSLDHPKNVATLLQSDLKCTCIRRIDRRMPCTHTGSGECNLRKPGGHTSLTNSSDDQWMVHRLHHRILCQLGGHTSLTNTFDDAGQSDAHLALDHPVTSESLRRRWSPSSGHSPERPTGTSSPRRINW